MRLYKIIRQNRGGANYGPQLVCAHILLTQSEKMISDHGKAMICTTGRPPPLLEKYYGIIMVLIRWYFGTVNFTMLLLTMVLTVKYTMANAPCITIMDTAILTILRMSLAMSAKSFSLSSPSVWNSLPYSCRSTKTVTTFKHALKTELFATAYGSP